MKRKIIALTVILGTTMLMLAGCGRSSSRNLNKLERYLEDTYDEDFEFVSITDSTPWGGNKNSVSAYFTCESFGDTYVKAYYGKSGRKEYYESNYKAIEYNQDALYLVEGILASAGYSYSEINMSIPDGVLPIDDVENYTFQDYMEDDQAYKSIELVLQQDDLTETDLDNIVNAFRKNNVSIKGLIMIPNNYGDKIISTEYGSISVAWVNVKKSVNFTLSKGELTYESWDED